MSIPREDHPVYIRGKTLIQVVPGMNVKMPNIPPEESATNPCFELELVSRTDDRSEDDLHAVNEFGTGLIIRPPHKHYIMILASDMLHKTGYRLATGPKIITADNMSEVKIQLYKETDGNDLELPYSGAVKMLVCPMVYAYISEVKDLAPQAVYGQPVYAGQYYDNAYPQYAQPVQQMPPRQPPGRRGRSSRGSHMF